MNTVIRLPCTFGSLSGVLQSTTATQGKAPVQGTTKLRRLPVGMESGITTVRNLGHSGIDGDSELRDAINAGQLVGPRILASGRKLVTRGETYVQNLNPTLADAILKQEFLLIEGADRAREAVRQNVFHNVDVIKVTAEENLTVPELTAVVEEAHRNRLKVAVHAVESHSIQTAIDAGADLIEHGNDISDEQLKSMREKGIFFDLTPTSYGHFFTKIFEETIAESLELYAERLQADELNRHRSTTSRNRFGTRSLCTGSRPATTSDTTIWSSGS